MKLTKVLLHVLWSSCHASGIFTQVVTEPIFVSCSCCLMWFTGSRPRKCEDISNLCKVVKAGAGCNKMGMRSLCCRSCWRWALGTQSCTVHACKSQWCSIIKPKITDPIFEHVHSSSETRPNLSYMLYIFSFLYIDFMARTTRNHQNFVHCTSSTVYLYMNNIPVSLYSSIFTDDQKHLLSKTNALLGSEALPQNDVYWVHFNLLLRNTLS